MGPLLDPISLLDYVDDFAVQSISSTEETMRVTSNTIYEHDEQGEVLVIDIHNVFNEYDLETGSGELYSRVVRYTPN